MESANKKIKITFYTNIEEQKAEEVRYFSNLTMVERLAYANTLIRQVYKDKFSASELSKYKIRYAKII